MHDFEAVCDPIDAAEQFALTHARAGRARKMQNNLSSMRASGRPFTAKVLFMAAKSVTVPSNMKFQIGPEMLYEPQTARFVNPILRPIAVSPRAARIARSLPIRLSPTATSGSVRPCSWTFTSVAIFGSHNRCQSSSDFSLTMRPVPATWRRLAGATGSFAPIVRRRESRSASQIVLASCAAASAAVTPD